MLIGEQAGDLQPAMRWLQCRPKGVLNTTRLGFKVKELMGGLDWWKRDGYPTSGEQGSQGNSEMLCGC
jgi:hypothetical protein